MKNNNNLKQLEAGELMDMIAKQLRMLDVLDVNDKSAMKNIAKSKEVFNGAGKAIKLSAFVYQQHGLATGGKLLPEAKKIK